MTIKSNTRIEQLLSMNDGDILNAEEAAELNLELARAHVNQISIERSSDVSDYIVTALNMKSIDENLVPNIEALLNALQNRR